MSWEVEFPVGKGGGEDGDVVSVWLPWTELKASYRGRKVDVGGGGGRGDSGSSFLQSERKKQKKSQHANSLPPPFPPHSDCDISYFKTQQGRLRGWRFWSLLRQMKSDNFGVLDRL